MKYARGFLALQLRFAETVAELAGLSLERALLDYTNLYIRFGIGRDFDPAHPRWQGYLAGLRAAESPGEWTYQFYLACPPAPPAPGLVATFGCFAYAHLPDGRVRLHFRNAEPPVRSPLGPERRAERVAELRALFDHVSRRLPDSTPVAGASWLYNLEAYRRLFPRAYVESGQVMRGRFQRMPLWGQFVDRHGEVREHAAKRFLDRLDRQAGRLEGIDECFPFQVIGVQAPVRVFLDWYRAGGPR
jgi:hypothetical protein